MPFILAHASAKPLSRLTQILSRPQNQELALGRGLAEILGNSGLEEIFRPFVGFFVFCFGKLILTASVLAANCMAMPNYKEKPFSIYSILGVLFLPTLGLHFFLAYQEFVFYSFCSFYRAFAKRVFATSEDEQNCARTLPTTHTSTGGEQKKTAVYVSPRQTNNGNLKELVDIMENMSKSFGPFLLQKFSFMLLFWLLHIYYLIYSVIATIRGATIFSNPNYLPLALLQFGGSVLIVG